MNLADLLRSGKKMPSAETLRQALAEAETEAKAVETEMATLRDRREALLLNGMDDAKLDAVEADLNKAYRRQDRADLLSAQLKERLAAAEQAERQDEVEKIRADGVAAQERGAQLLERYAGLARQMLETVEQLAHAEAEIRSANVRLHARGDEPRALQGIEAAHWHGRERMQQFPEWSIVDALKLPHPDEPRRLLWPRQEA